MWLLKEDAVTAYMCRSGVVVVSASVSRFVPENRPSVAICHFGTLAGSSNPLLETVKDPRLPKFLDFSVHQMVWCILSCLLDLPVIACLTTH